MAFLPLVIAGFVDLFLEDEPDTKMLIIRFSGLALSHNLTLLLSGIGFVVLMILHYRTIAWLRIKKLIQAAFITLGLCAWFLFPMLEQTSFQPYYLHYYASSSDLGSHALMSWQYLINETIFGLSGKTYAYEQTMVVTPGLALLFLPVLGLFDIREKDKFVRFSYLCTLIGFVFVVLCSDIIPREHMTFLRIMQFPWRWMTLACVFLSVGAAVGCARVVQNRRCLLIIFTIILLNSVHLLLPVHDRTLVIHNDTSYEELLSGSIIDHYYGNTSYNRIKVAGADYLQQGFLDYKNASTCIIDTAGNTVSCDLQKEDTLAFTAPENKEIIVPLTSYKGYHVYSGDEELTWSTVSGRISFNTQHHTEFVIVYRKTMLHLISIGLSMAALTFIIIKNIAKGS